MIAHSAKRAEFCQDYEIVLAENSELHGAEVFRQTKHLASLSRLVMPWWARPIYCPGPSSSLAHAAPLRTCWQQKKQDLLLGLEPGAGRSCSATVSVRCSKIKVEGSPVGFRLSELVSKAWRESRVFFSSQK